MFFWIFYVFGSSDIMLKPISWVYLPILEGNLFFLAAQPISYLGQGHRQPCIDCVISKTTETYHTKLYNFFILELLPKPHNQSKPFHLDLGRVTKHWHKQKHQAPSKATLKCCYALYSYVGTVFSHDKEAPCFNNSIHLPQMEKKNSTEDGVWLPMWWDSKTFKK